MRCYRRQRELTSVVTRLAPYRPADVVLREEFQVAVQPLIWAILIERDDVRVRPSLPAIVDHGAKVYDMIRSMDDSYVAGAFCASLSALAAVAAGLPQALTPKDAEDALIGLAMVGGDLFGGGT